VSLTGDIIQRDVTEQHDVPETWSDERMHQLDSDCWCRPEVVRIVRDTDGTLRERQVVHRAEVAVEVTA
jgi:hypothetical protein